MALEHMMMTNEQSLIGNNQARLREIQMEDHHAKKEKESMDKIVARIGDKVVKAR